MTKKFLPANKSMIISQAERDAGGIDGPLRRIQKRNALKRANGLGQSVPIQDVEASTDKGELC